MQTPEDNPKNPFLHFFPKFDFDISGNLRTFNMLLGKPQTNPEALPMLNPQQQYGLQIFRPRVKSQFNEMLDNSIEFISCNF